VFVARAWWLRTLLGIIAVGVTIHLLQLKTLTREMLKKPAEADTGEAVSGQPLNDTPTI